MAKAGTLEIDLVAKTAKFIEDMKKSSTAVERMATQANRHLQSIERGFKLVIASAGAFVAAAAASRLVHMFNAAAESVDLLGKKAKNLGVAVGPLSVLKFAAGEAGVDFDTLAKMAAKAQKNLAEFARTGRDTGDRALNELMRDLVTTDGSMASIDVLMPRIARHLERVGSQGEKLRLAEKIFGRAGGEAFVQLLEDSGGNLDKLAEKAQLLERLGGVVTQEQVDRLTEYNDAVGRIGVAWNALLVRVMTEVAPTLAHLADDFAVWVGTLGKVLGSVLRKIGEAFGSGPEADLAREQIKQLGLDFGNVLAVSLSSGGEIAVAALYDTLVAGWGVLADEAGAWGKKVALRFMDPFTGPVLGHIFRKWYSGKVDQSQPNFLQRLQQAEYPNARSAMDSAVVNVSVAVDRLGKSVDELDLAGKFEDAATAAAAFKREVGEPPDKSNWEKFFAGVENGFSDLVEKADQFQQLGASMTTTLFTNISSGFAGMLTQADTNFKNFGKRATQVIENVTRRLAEMALEFAILRGLTGIAAGVGTAFGASATAGTGTTGSAGYTATGSSLEAHGDAFANGQIVPFKHGGVVFEPSLFTYGQNIGAVGEAGRAEGILPLERIGNDLGVKATGMTGTVVQIIDQRSGGAAPEVRQSQGADGQTQVQVIIRDSVRAGLQRGDFDRVLSDGFGLNRRAASR